jgi:hypothetical protein
MFTPRAAIEIRLIALVKPPFKSSDDYPHIGSGKKPDREVIETGD